LISNLKTSGIRVHSIHTPFSAKCDLSSLDDAIHEKGVVGLIESIELAQLFEARNVIVHASDKIAPEDNKRRFNRAKGVLREMSLLAAESSVIITIENLPPGYLASNPKEFIKLIESIDKESVKGCFDTGHANLTGDFEDFAKQALPYCVTTHIHDNNGDADTHLFPGKGSIDWKAFGNLYHHIESNASIMMECFPANGMNWISAFQLFRSTVGL
jgi:sugar phosphate isomerase/epimerase